jgi:hypothetical protein
LGRKGAVTAMAAAIERPKEEMMKMITPAIAPLTSSNSDILRVIKHEKKTYEAGIQIV